MLDGITYPGLFPECSIFLRLVPTQSMVDYTEYIASQSLEFFTALAVEFREVPAETATLVYHTSVFLHYLLYDISYIDDNSQFHLPICTMSNLQP